MANVMSMKKLRNKPSRSGFDFSRKVAFTGKIGELMVSDCIEVIPDDYYEIKKQHFTRTMPVNTAAYTRIREYYDWFFVPTNLLWNKFNQFVTQMTDNNTKATSISDNASVGNIHPYMTSEQVNNYLSSLARRNDKNIFGYDRAYQSAKLLEYLGYGNSWYYAAENATNGTMYENVNLNPFPLLAYQKIYQDYYRNSQWENGYAPACNIDYMSSKTNMQLPIEDIDTTQENMFDMRYVNWNKDYFMGLLPNSQYGARASVDLSTLVDPTDWSGINIQSQSTTPNESVTTNANKFLQSGSNPSWKLSGVQISNLASSLGLTSSNLQSAFTILALRQAEAAQKWAEITQSNQQDYKSQIEAHFGVNVSDAYSDRCQFIDGQVSTLDINEVQNTNLADDNAANIGGKGVGSGDGSFKFSSKVHGYLMCIYHAQPILDYQINGVKKLNLKTIVTDYAIPEFDRTGMVSVPFSELYSIRNDDPAVLQNYAGMLLGYAPQYYEYKTRYDEVLGGFVNGALDNWVAPFTQYNVVDYILNNTAILASNTVNYVFFKINPAVLNPIFVGQITPEDNGNDKDQLLINCSFDVKVVRSLDYDGLPY